MRVLLLGGTGNLGSRLIPALLAHKHEVIVVVRNERKLKDMVHSNIISAITIVTGDATDSSVIKDALVKYKCTALINSAGLAAVFPWQAPRLQGIIHAVANAAVDASKELGYPIRAWFMGGLGVLDYPGMQGVKLKDYFPVFPEHELTYAFLSAKPQSNLRWSMCCPSVMVAESQTISVLSTPHGNRLKASADVPPEWQPSMLNFIPFVGPLLSALGNGLRAKIKLEDCADFIAADLEHPEEKFVGKRVGVIEGVKAKDD